PVMPAAVFAEMAIASSRRVLGEGWESIEEVSLTQPLAPGTRRRRVQLVLNPGPERARFEVLSRPLEGGAWTRHAHGWLGRGKSRAGGQDLTLEAARARCQREIQVEERYQALAGVGLEYGPAFQGLEKLWLGEGEALGRVRLPEVASAEASRYHLHPALLESCLQIATVGLEGTAEAGWVVSGWRRGRVEGRASGVLHGHAVRRPGREPGAPSEIDLRVWDEAGRSVVEFEGLVLQQARRPLEEALYTLAWLAREQARSEGTSRPEKPGRWLLLGERGGAGEEVARRLEALGAECVWARAGQQQRVLGPGLYEVDPARPDAFDTLVRQETDLRGVLHLWSLDMATGVSTTAETLIDAERLLSLSTLHLVQSLSRLGGTRAPRLWLVTRGAQAVAEGDAPVAVAQAPMWGLGRTVMREHPELRCVCVDLGSQVATDEYEALVGALFQEDREEQLAFRGQRRYVARLVPHELPARTAPLKSLSPEASYLVTGGLGALGQVVARWLVERGARHLVLMGRSPPSELARATISELERAGARIRVEQVDLARPEAVTRALSSIEGDMPPLRGVLHLAGTIEDAPLVRMTVEQFRRVTSAKLEGAWNLHALTAGKPLDFFVLFSSLASLLGSPGQANYAAANASLEALAAHRRALGLPAVCFNWGAWKVGMATRFSESYWRERNLRQIAPEEGMAVLARMGDADVPQLAAPAVDWARFLSDADEIPPVFDEITARFRRTPRGERASVGGLAEKIREARPGERRELLISSLQHGVAAVLGFDASKPLERKGFFDMGMDSLSALRFSQRLKAEIGSTLPVSVIFRYPTVESLAHHILEDVLQIPAEAPAPAPVEDRALDTEVAQMSDLEVQAALAELADSVLGDGDEAE
ncbi:type I polyketide synthase, partial [Hyalangium sp.]|uniref:type I polyketide synthase n=1 Tax=Hyalangium sp. TaxID=2028555 RepID=UPI002D393FFD